MKDSVDFEGGIVSGLVKKSAEQMEEALKRQMSYYGLTIPDVTRVSYPDHESFIDLKNKKVILKRRYVPEKLLIEVVTCCEDIDETLFNKIISEGEPKLDWDVVRADTCFRVEYADEYNLVVIRFEKNERWRIDITGVSSEYVEGYSIQDVNKVKKLAEEKLHKTLDKIQAIIQRSK